MLSCVTIWQCAGRDMEERDRWIRALESVIHQHSGYYRPLTRVYTIAEASLKTIPLFALSVIECDADACGMPSRV